MTPPIATSAYAPSPGWPILDRTRALSGLAGEIVETIEPETEADAAGLLVTLLVMFGSAAGPAPHATVGAVPHPARLSAVLVGETSRGRKGQGRAEVQRIMAKADPDWCDGNIVSGLASGEGLIWRVRDGDDEDDHAVADKRLLVVEPEWAKVARVAQREGNTLSAIVRECWDSGRLESLTKRNPIRATGAHVSILAHITVPELRRVLTETDAANGYANRHLFALVGRARLLPEGGHLPPEKVDELGASLRGALCVAQRAGRLTRTASATERWAELYGFMDENAPGGMVGEITARAEAQCLRLSVAYALLDGARSIDLVHLEAAWAVWQYCEASANYIFGDSLGDEVADRLLAALRAAGPEGLTGTQQRTVFARHVSAARLAAARTRLEEGRLAATSQRATDGRPVTVTIAIGAQSAVGAKPPSGASSACGAR